VWGEGASNLWGHLDEGDDERGSAEPRDAVVRLPRRDHDAELERLDEEVVDDPPGLVA
jgi:hypothetical protein